MTVYSMLAQDLAGSPFSSSYREAIRALASGLADFKEIEDALRELLVIPQNDEIGIARLPINARVTGSITPLGTWPALYQWKQTRPTPSGYVIMPTSVGLSSDTPGLETAKNRVELLSGFGSTVGPYGQSLTLNSGATLEVQQIATGSDIVLWFEGGTTTVFMRFDAVNPALVSCPEVPE